MHAIGKEQSIVTQVSCLYTKGKADINSKVACNGCYIDFCCSVIDSKFQLWNVLAAE